MTAETETAEVARRIAELGRWHYEFDLRGHRTPVHYPSHVNRHAQRAAYFFTPLVEACGGDLTGKRVLDLGCNAGFWSLKAIEAGCEFVLGIDARPENIAQARFVHEVKDVPRDRYRFVTGDVYEYDYAAYGPFDIVLNLGLVYHVHRTVDLFRIACTASRELVLTDTSLSMAAGPFLELRYETTELPVNAIGDQVVLYPTARAVLELSTAFGCAAQIIAPEITDPTGCWEYVPARLATKARRRWCT